MDLILVVSSCLTNESEEKVADWRKAVVIAEGRRRHWPHRDNWSEVEDEGTVQLHWSFLHPFPPRSITNGVKDPYRSLQRMKISEGLQPRLMKLNTGRTSRRYEEIADTAVVVIGCI